jgi:3-oxoacyl-[acyl-carrier-protein] synthase-3
MAVVLAGTGHALPERIVPSSVVEVAAGKPLGWTMKRVGIQERRACAPDERSWHLGAEAARRALADAGLSASDVDLLIVHVTLPVVAYPDPAWYIARDLGISGSATVMGQRGQCAGFLIGLRTAEQFLLGGGASCALVVCAERMHQPMLGYERSAVLFGDGAGAAVLRRGDSGGLQGILLGQRADKADRCAATSAVMPREGWDAVSADIAPSWGDKPLPSEGMASFWEGRDIFQHAVVCMGEATEQVLAAAGLQVEDIDHFLYHQANAKILKSLVRNFSLPPERTHTNIALLGNIASATVPVLLDAGRRAGRIRPGERVLMGAFGAGYTFGAAILEI